VRCITLTKITDRLKEKVRDAKDKVVETKDKVTDTTKETIRGTDAAATKISSQTDSTSEYQDKEPMSPAKLKEHEPTAVKRKMTEKIIEGGKTSIDPEGAKEIARKSGMAEETAGAGEGGDEYE
jgi:hypothetical protein